MEAPKQRRGQNVARELRRVIVPLWGNRPAADVTRAEVQAMIETVRDKGAVAMLAGHGIKLRRGNDRPTPTSARALLSYVRSVFSWAIERGAYGLEASPCDHISAERILGPRRQRARTLAPDELFAFWRAVTRMPYPVGPSYQLLALAGLRLNEVYARRAQRIRYARQGLDDSRDPDERQERPRPRPRGAIRRPALSRSSRRCPPTAGFFSRRRETARISSTTRKRPSSTPACCARSAPWRAIAARIGRPSSCKISSTTICEELCARRCLRSASAAGFASMRTSRRPCSRT